MMTKKIVLIALCLASSAFAQIDWSRIETVLGRKGEVKDYMLKVFFPRSDLDVKINGVKIDPALGLTSWFGFILQDNVVSMDGNIVVTDKELPQIEAKLIDGGIGITSIHNNLVGEIPPVKTIRIEAKGDGEKIAEKIKNILSLTGTPLTPPAGQNIDTEWSTVESLMTIRGERKGSILHYSFSRPEVIKVHAMEIPSYLGLGTEINIQKAGDKLCAAADLAVIAVEIRPVMKALEKHGFTITGLDNIMLMESPRIFVLHAWGYDVPSKIALGLFTALKEMHL